MEFGQGRQDCYEEEEEEIIGDINKLPFSSSSSSSPSSSQYKAVIPQLNGQWGAQIYEKEAARSFDRAVFKPIDSSPRNNDDVGIIESDGGETSGGGGGLGRIEREHMFDKVVTPSDVGKLNRLVIPKQHAEKYFPLDSSTNEKGLLLNFEDLSGKPWRFRYSYWNSSQSYVMTKGWSRFVKEKKLDAGDIVSFERGVGESSKDRLFIDWRRRPNAPDPHTFSLPTSAPWGRFFMPPPAMPMSVPERNYLHLQQQLNYGNLHHQHQHQHHQHPSSYSGSSYGCNVVNPGPGSVIYLRSSAPHQVGVVQQGGDVPMVFDSVPVVHGKAAAKRVRLFGVNLECPIQEDTECDILSSSRIPEHTTMASLSSPQLIPPSPLPPLQLRLFNGTPLPTMLNELPRQGKPSLSFNLDI